MCYRWIFLRAAAAVSHCFLDHTQTVVCVGLTHSIGVCQCEKTAQCVPAFDVARIIHSSIPQSLDSVEPRRA
jgi:hypothetical protein